MRRRAVLVGLFAFPLVRRVAAKERPRISILHSGFPNRTPIHLLMEALRALGYEDGSTATVELLGAEGDADRLNALIVHLAAQRPDVIIAITSPAVLGLKQAALPTPVVFLFLSDPVGLGIIESAGRPGGNFTGITYSEASLGGKRLELLVDALPGTKRVAVLWSMGGFVTSSPYPSKRRSDKIAHRRLSTGPTLPQGCWGLGMNSKRLVGDRRAIVAGVAGNVMEWYDFSVYGYFAANIGRHFFPAQSEVSSLIAAFGVFAAGFLMRPLGSLVFGHIGDKMGRKMALTASVALMAIPTFLIGALPTYQQIGVTASVLLVLMRLLQGLSVGGEYTTSSIFLVERSAAGHRGFFGSFAEVGACSGILLGSALSALVTTVLDRAMVDSWGWRIPFLIGVTVGIAGLYIRRYLVEETGPQRHHLKAASPIREAFTEWRTILRLIGLGAVGAVGFYMSFVYITTYLRQIDHIAQSTALDINTVAMVVLLLLLAPVGALSDHFGRKPVLLIATGGVALMAWPLFWMLHHNSPLVILLGQIGFAILSAFFWGTIPATMVELVPARVRCTVLSLGYNTGMAILGGLTPMVAVYTIKRSEYDLAPAFLLMAAAAVSFTVVIALRETYKMSLPDTAAARAEAA